MTDPEVRERVSRLEDLITAAGDGPAVLNALQAVVELYGEALARCVRGADPAKDELISHLLLVHGIEPPVLLQIAPLHREAAAV